jgi:hypothetical protein
MGRHKLDHDVHPRALTEGPPPHSEPPPGGNIRVRTVFALALVLVLSWQLPLQAQQERGDVELQFTGTVLSTTGRQLTTTSGIVKAKVGYFVTDRVEFGVFPSLLFAETRVEVAGVSQTNRETRFGLGAFGAYSFLAADATTVPYLGLQFYRIDLTDENETGWAGVNGGLKFYISRTTAFDVGANYLLGLGDEGGALFLFQFGLSFLL